MNTIRIANLPEKIRGTVYKHSSPVVAGISLLIAIVVFFTGNIGAICKNAVTLAVTGVAVAAFLFTAQSILVAVSSDNPFIRALRHEGNYMSLIHRFCRRAELAFVFLLLPMLYMEKATAWLNIILLSGYVYSLLFTIWAMSLIGKILIISEKHPSQ